MKDFINTPPGQDRPSPLAAYSLHSITSSPSHEPPERPGLHSHDRPSALPSVSTTREAPPLPQDNHNRETHMWNFGGLGLIELGRQVFSNVLANDCLGHAAQLAYYFLFALFPFLLFLTTLLGYVPVPHLLDRLMDSLSRALPGEALELVRNHVRTIVTQQRGGLLSFSIIAAVWTASSAVLATIHGLNRAYQAEESRPWWKVRGLSMLLVLGLSLFMIAASVLLIFGPQLGNWLAGEVGLGNAFALAWDIVHWPVSIALLMVGLAILYYFGPEVVQRWRWITPGSVFAVIGWIIASLGFSYYVTNFSSYNVTYGGIGAVIVLLTWLYLTAVFILVGGEVNAAIEHASLSRKAPGERAASALQNRE